MDSTRAHFPSINEYIDTFPEATRSKLQELRDAIHSAAPDADEKISYQMPTFYLKGNLVHFAAYDAHIGFYPAPSGIAAFQEELSAYKHAKGSVQFPLDKPIPFDLVRRIVAFRVKENEEKAAAKKKPA